MKGCTSDSIIQSLGAEPFYVSYWCTSEINTYRLYCRHNKCPQILIDATGSLVCKIKLLTGRLSRHIFLHKITANNPQINCTFSVAHLLSERHNNHSIGMWLGEWMRSDILYPKVVVMDHSLALIMAAVSTFTQYSTLTKYLWVCSSFLRGDSSQGEIPMCFIRHDFNHVMKNITSWPEFKDSLGKQNTNTNKRMPRSRKNKKLKNFYCRSLGLVIASTRYNDIKFLLKRIFTVALHEEDGINEEGSPTDCELAKQYLKRRIASHM